MPWVETDSLSFTARHDSGDAAFAERTLDRMEELRLRLEDRFEVVPGEITVVVHTNPALAGDGPPVPAGGPLVGGAGRPPLPRRLGDGDASCTSSTTRTWNGAPPGEDSREALRGTAERLYAQLVIAANNPDLPPSWTPRRFARYLALGLAGRGRRPVLLAPGRPLPGRGDPPPARELPALLPALAPRRGDPRRHDLRPARDRARPRGLRAAGDGAAAGRSGPTLEAAFDARIAEIEDAWRDHLRAIARPASP